MARLVVVGGCVAVTVVVGRPQPLKAAPSAFPVVSEVATQETEPPQSNIGRPALSPLERPRAELSPLRACSFDERVCVHFAREVPDDMVLETLRDGESAIRALRSLSLPLPLPDGSLGGDDAFDIYLVAKTPKASVGVDLPVRLDGWDRSSAFVVLAPQSWRSKCHRGFVVAEATARAGLMGLDAGAEEGAVAMSSSYVASLIAPCPALELVAVDDFQRHPERSLMSLGSTETTGALLFPWYLDDWYGRRGPGVLWSSVLAMATQRTPASSWGWVNEPDAFDVLRSTMRDRGGSLDGLLLDFAIARAFMGARSDGAHASGTEWFGDFARIHFEWAIPYDTLPRRLAPAGPIEATGMTYLWVDTSTAPEGAELTLVADWELPSMFRWSLVKVDTSGAAVGRVDVAGLFGSSHAERTVVGVHGLGGVLVVGVNVGSMDRSHPYDPDEEPLMPHSYTVMFAK